VNSLVKCHPTLLHDLMHRYSIKPEMIETIKVTRFDTRWIPNITSEIITNLDKAIETISNDSPDVKVFTD
jgi:hypothetical protein